jgi:DNA-binding MarR family transcriptional regulator
MSSMETSAQTLAELLAQVGRAAYCMSASEDLTPAQWMALRYVSRANRFSRTVSAFADYHATTRGTASQTVKRLIEQGYLTRIPSTRDGRSVRLDLTKKGRGTLLDDPLEALVRSVDGIPRRTRADMTRRLERVLEHLARERGGCLFGTCPSCRHLQIDSSSVEGEHKERCRLFDEPLQPEELERICVNFAPMRCIQPAT